MTRRVWLVEVGEPLPVDEGARSMRTGLLARKLASMGYQVTWWADAFNHQRKTYRAPGNVTVQVGSGLTLELLWGPPYSRNVSLVRFRNQRAVAAQFERLAPTRPAPDVIYCGYPTIELAHAAFSYADKRRVPLLVDVRDPWPHLFLSHVPRSLRWLGKLLLSGQFRMGREVLRGATAVTSVSRSFLDWALDYSGRGRNPRDEVFYLGYEDPAGRSQEPVDLGPGPKGEVLRCLFIGTFGASYDLHTVLAAARRLQESGESGVQFVLAGDGPEAPRLREAARGLSNVVLPGWLEAASLRYLLANSDVGLIAHNVPGAVPNKSFEYLSSGLALLNTTKADLFDLIETHRLGLNYPVGDVEALVSCVKTLLGDRERLRSMKAAARALFHERFEAGAVYGALAAKLTGLADSPPARQTLGGEKLQLLTEDAVLTRSGAP
ncbi:MAG: glycosyltransferase family 4 protein [Candidatus Riflebacteria bacterium]|nr:glycosyltransferase family 4 protein [Candidatus Riflebacteria bacterium]